MAPEQAALLHAEQPLGDGGIPVRSSQQLLWSKSPREETPCEFLAEQQAHAVEGLASSRSSAVDLADLVIAMSDIDLDIAIEDLLPLDAELARIGMDGDEPLALRQIARLEDALLVGSVMDVFRIDEADLRRAASALAWSINSWTKRSCAGRGQLDGEIGIMGERVGTTSRITAPRPRGAVDAADAGEVRLHEMQGILPRPPAAVKSQTASSRP
jgi:hypothetical protein